MADTGIFATTAEVIRKAGANASTTSATEAYINDYMTQVESQINVFTRYNWSDVYSSLNADVKGLLNRLSSPGKGEELLGYIPCFDRCRFSFIQYIIDITAPVNMQFCKVNIPQNACKYIVIVMGYASSQEAEGFKSLYFYKFLFKLFVLCNIRYYGKAL